MSPTRNPNPTPRRALGKAPDATVHPATARPLEPAVAVVPASPAPARGTGRTRTSRKKAFRGATSDVLRPVADPARELVSGKVVRLQVQIPKRLRKAALAQAERTGTPLDDVVTGLLAGWVDGS